MYDFNVIQLAVGAFCCMVLAISGAFVVYWHLFAKKHLAMPQQRPQEIKHAEKPFFKLGGAGFKHSYPTFQAVRGIEC